MTIRKSRKIKGKIVGWVYAEKVREPYKGKKIKKTIRENVLKDVKEKLNKGKTRKEIHRQLCIKYGFRDYNPVEERYIEYLRKDKKH